MKDGYLSREQLIEKELDGLERERIKFNKLRPHECCDPNCCKEALGHHDLCRYEICEQCNAVEILVKPIDERIDRLSALLVDAIPDEVTQ